MDLKKFYEQQISLSEWLESIDHTKKDEFRLEDNEKRERLRLLSEHIDIPFDKPTQFTATDLVNNTKIFTDFYSSRADELCALRLIPLDHKLPKLRMRGVKVSEVMEWFKEQNVDHSKYRAEFIPHSENAEWSTIFVVSKNGIFGEIIKGMHSQLTQGFYEKNLPIFFTYDFESLKLSRVSSEARKQLNEIFSKIKVSDNAIKDGITKSIDCEFSHDFIVGYFETIRTKEYGLWFIDFNRVLGKMYDSFSFPANIKPPLKTTSNNKTLVGITGSHGKASGRARLILAHDLGKIDLVEGEILVCDVTTPNYVPYMAKAGAIVTDRGGMLSHAAIVSRELQKPCVVACQHATLTIKTGDYLEVDATAGIVTISN